MSQEAQNLIEEAAGALGLSSMRLSSGAGHDAQKMASITRIGMIFIPSIGGISHSPKECSREDDIANGVICGFGKNSYLMALGEAIHQCKPSNN